MTSEKHWSHKSNEKEPGNPLSRLPGYNERMNVWDAAEKMQGHIRELLAVIDRQEEEKTENLNLSTRGKEVLRLRAQLAAAEEEKNAVHMASEVFEAAATQVMKNLVDEFAKTVEARERKAFEAGRKKVPWVAFDDGEVIATLYEHGSFDSYLATQSAEKERGEV